MEPQTENIHLETETLKIRDSITTATPTIKTVTTITTTTTTTANASHEERITFSIVLVPVFTRISYERGSDHDYMSRLRSIRAISKPHNPSIARVRWTSPAR